MTGTRMTRIKICGITRNEDALAAARMGADALGFVFAESPRRISPDRAREIISGLPPFLTTVGVFVNEAADKVNEVCRFCGLNLVQLHGDEDGAYMARLGRPAIRAFRVKDGDVLNEIKRLEPGIFILDAFDGERAGGTGKTFDWTIAEKAAHLGRVILSGGLGARNITSALETVRPYAVDVSSGVESAPGVKDHRKMEEFIQEVRHWDSRTS